MLFPSAMEKAELLIFKADADAVLEYLGGRKCFQVSGRAEGEDSPRREKLEELHRKILAVKAFLGDEQPAADAGLPEEPRVPRDDDIAAAEKLCAGVEPLVQTEKNLTERRQKAKNVLDEVEAFRRLDLPLRDIESVTFLAFRIGVVPPANLPDLRAALSGRALVLELDAEGRIFAVSSKKGRFALDTELKKANFRETPVPDNLKNLPPDVLAAMENEFAAAENELEKLQSEKAAFARLSGGILHRLSETLAAGICAEELKAHLVSTETAYVLSGWLPKADAKKIIAGLETLTHGRVAARTYKPEEVDAVLEGKEQVPVRLHHGKFLQAFSGIVVSYGAPLYGTVDPTAIVSVFFVLLFAIMFGDVGQGFVGILAGFLLSSGKVAALRGWKKFAPVFIAVGSACMVTGFLYGSVFCNEHLLTGPTRFITGRLFGHEMDRFITLLPNHGIDKILGFFGFTIGIGVIINTIGLIINIYNRFKLRDFRHAVFAKTGLVGAFFFWYVIFLAVRLVMGGAFLPVDAVCLALPLILLFWGEPLSRIFSRERPLFPEGIFTFIMEGFVEVMETVSYFISNSVSFLRVGAFALSHAVLSMIIFTLAGLLSGVPGGIVFRVLIIAGGNILIIVLEGLIVAIQVIRLHYYEFFSKFFTESGEAWKPFELRSPKK